MKEKKAYIQGIRGFSILMVVLFHFLYRFYEIYNVKPVCKNFVVVNFGTLGVGFFLVLTGIFLFSGRPDSSFFKSMLHKITRLWPTYFLCITITFIVTSYFCLEGRTVSLTTYLANVTMLNGFVGIAYVDSAHWYLTTIIAVYFIAIIIDCLGLRDKYFPYLFWIVLSFCFWHLNIQDFNGIIGKIIGGLYLVLGGSRIGFVVLGVMLKRVLSYFPNGHSIRAEVLTSILAIAHIWICNDFIMLVESVLIVTLLALTMCGGVQRILSSKPLVIMGDASYSIFLIHQNIGYVIVTELTSVFEMRDIFASFVAIVFTIALGIIIYYLFERHVTNLLKVRFSKL